MDDKKNNPPNNKPGDNASDPKKKGADIKPKAGEVGAKGAGQKPAAPQAGQKPAAPQAGQKPAAAQPGQKPAAPQGQAAAQQAAAQGQAQGPQQPSQPAKPEKKPLRGIKNFWHTIMGQEEEIDLENPPEQGVGAGANVKSNANSDAFEVSRSVHLFFLLQFLMVILFILWAVFFKVDVSSSAVGEVIPSTKIKPIEHLEGGIVGKVLVKEGQVVKKGQALVELSSTASGADLEQLQLRLAAAKLDLARFAAELKGKSMMKVPDLGTGHDQAINQSKQLLKVRNEKYKHGYNSQKEKVVQQTREVEELSARLKRVTEQLKLLQEQIGISAELLKENVTSRYAHITLMREGKGLDSQVIQLEADLRQAQSALKESQSTFDEFISTHSEEVRQGISETQRQLEEYQQQITKQQDTHQRGIIRSPVDGIVKQLAVTTPGEVIQAGETIMDIVPQGDLMVIEAKLPVADIGYIEKGQPADIRLASADGARFKPIRGKVVYISADALKDEKDDSSYYEIRIQPGTQFFAKDEMKYHLYPGMSVSVAIITGRRSILDYLFQPMMGNLSSALTER
jgi:adhesin transport system membrane fusion protein